MISRNEASELAEKASIEQLNQMMINVLNQHTGWHKPSRTNVGLSNRQAYDIFKDLFKKEKLNAGIGLDLIKTNAIHCFGEYLPAEINPLNARIYEFDGAGDDGDLPW